MSPWGDLYDLPPGEEWVDCHEANDILGMSGRGAVYNFVKRNAGAIEHREARPLDRSIRQNPKRFYSKRDIELASAARKPREKRWW